MKKLGAGVLLYIGMFCLFGLFIVCCWVVMAFGTLGQGNESIRLMIEAGINCMLLLLTVVIVFYRKMERLGNPITDGLMHQLGFWVIGGLTVINMAVAGWRYYERYDNVIIALSVSIVGGLVSAAIEFLVFIMLGMIIGEVLVKILQAFNDPNDPLFFTYEYYRKRSRIKICF